MDGAPQKKPSERDATFSKETNEEGAFFSVSFLTSRVHEDVRLPKATEQAMNGQKIPTFHMGQKDTIGEEATVICVWIGDRMHVLTNEASIRIKAAIVDCEMSEMRHYFANDATQGWFWGGDKPLIARKWRGHVFVWSFANNIWQTAS